MQSLDVLDISILAEDRDRAVDTLARCQDTNGGGFGGGPGQLPHLAPTYAAIHALAIIGTEEAYKCIYRSAQTH